QQEDMGNQLDEIERLLREGKTDEAMAKLQQLGMQMEEMLANLDNAEQESGEQQYPELAQKFQEFMDDLKKTTQEQKEVADETKGLRDQYKQQMKERLQKQGQAL